MGDLYYMVLIDWIHFSIMIYFYLCGYSSTYVCNKEQRKKFMLHFKVSILLYFKMLWLKATMEG